MGAAGWMREHKKNRVGGVKGERTGEREGGAAGVGEQTGGRGERERGGGGGGGVLILLLFFFYFFYFDTS